MSQIPDYEDPLYIRARAYTVITTLDACRQRMESQAGAAATAWKEKLSEKTKEYREILRDPDNAKAPVKARAGYFDQIRELVAERDALAEEKAADMKERKIKLAQLDEADAEAKTAHRTSAAPPSAQLTLVKDAPPRPLVPGMPWATKSTLGVLYTALLDIENRGTPLDEFQAELLTDLAGASIEGADLGLEAAEAIEDDGAKEFESEDDETPDADLPF